MNNSLSLRTIFVISAATLLLMIFANEYMLHLEYRHKEDIERRNVLNQAATVRAHLEYEINTTLNLTMGLVVFVASNPEFTQAEFDRVAGEILQKAPHIRNIGLARDNVISYVYPLAGNEAILGVNYMNLPDQKAAVVKAIETGKTVIAGPVDLMQGGKAFISRIPIYIGQDRHYWGLASVVIDTDAMFARCNLSSEHPGVAYALRGKDGKGAAGEVFFGDPKIFSIPKAVVLPISLPVGSWLLAATSSDQDSAASPLELIIKTLGFILALIVSGLVFALLISYRRIHHMALHDSLTGLSNRRCFDQFVQQTIAVAKRRKATFSLLYIDLNGFKQVNDTYGHKQGDTVLTEVAGRLRRSLREADAVFRIGGDEFVLALEGPQSKESASLVAEKLTTLIYEPISLDQGQQVRLTAAVGISIYPQDGESADELIRQADGQMYDAKDLITKQNRAT